jgi:2'-5' RNA ligase
MSGTTAVYVPVPEALSLTRRTGAPARRWLHRDQPPHVTLLWPFLPPAAIDDAVRSALRELAAETPSFEMTFSRLGKFPEVVYLAPDDPAPFVSLTQRIVDRWPQCPPYAGAFEDVIPHVSLCTAAELPPGVTVSDLLPVRTVVRELRLAADLRWRGWTTLERLPLRTS